MTVQPLGSLPLVFDWANPDYTDVFIRRQRRLLWLRADPTRMSNAKLFYRDNPADFINDWGVTFDPRNADVKRPTYVPFILFPKQREWIDWIMARWRGREPGITEKSRDMGISWLATSLAATLCIFNDGVVIGFGSRKEEYVDKIGSPKSLFYKARMFIQSLPHEFRGGCDVSKHAPHMRVTFPATGSTMVGEAGDSIGRGDRTSIHFVDESAHLEHPLTVDASLSATTNCRQDLSSVNGMDNSFAQRRHSGKIKVFTFHWRDDPRKDDAWYAKQVEELDAVVVAQEIDINYSASATGILIPSAWAQASVDAHKVLGIEPRGRRVGSLDIADKGPDLNSYANRHGIVLKRSTVWSGKADTEDIFETVELAANHCDEDDTAELIYDADGLGAGARGDARVINARRAAAGVGQISVVPHRGSGAVFKPDDAIPTAQPGASKRDTKARTNKDYFQNFKAQSWWSLRLRFLRTFRAVGLVTKGEVNPYDPDDLISLDKEALGDDLVPLLLELSQATFKTHDLTGKMQVNKAPDGTKSPNRADAVNQAYAPRKMSWLNAYD